MVEKSTERPAPASLRLIDFDEAKVVPETFILVVSGEKHWKNLTVRLVPLVCIGQPEYWGIEVTGSLNGIGLPATAPYTESLPLDGITGTRGIEVIGAYKRETIAPPGSRRPVLVPASRPGGDRGRPPGRRAGRRPAAAVRPPLPGRRSARPLGCAVPGSCRLVGVTAGPDR